MGIDNVKLWFAKNERNEIVTIDDLKGSNTYLCPVCGSDLIPKATESKRITPHFAHVDKSKCNNESMMHFWFKHKFLEQGDKFKVVTDKEIEYVCKNVLVEQQYTVGDKIYKPDVTIITECGKTIYFEMNYSNKKEVKDYIDIWLELKNVVVEIDIKQLMSKSTLPSFKALFYKGKCLNTKRNDAYYNTIGKYKEEIYKYEKTLSTKTKESIKKIDWFWNDVFKYNQGEVDIDYMAKLIESFERTEADVVKEILKKSFCTRLYKDYKDFITLDNDIVFKCKPGVGYFLCKDLSVIKKELAKIDENFKITFELKSEYKSQSYYNGSRKYPYKYRKVFSHYRGLIVVEYKNKNVKKIRLTNRFLKNYDFNEFYLSISKLLEEYELKIRCSHCRSTFSMPTKEIKFYDSKGFVLPKRCKSCRDKRKQLKGRD